MAHFNVRPVNISSEPEGSYHMCNAMTWVELSKVLLHTLFSALSSTTHKHSTRLLSFKFNRLDSNSHTWYLYTHRTRIYFNIIYFFKRRVSFTHRATSLFPLFPYKFAICRDERMEKCNEIFILLCIYALTLRLTATTSEWWHVNQSSSHKYFTCLLFLFEYAKKKLYTLTSNEESFICEYIETDSS